MVLKARLSTVEEAEQPRRLVGSSAALHRWSAARPGAEGPYERLAAGILGPTASSLAPRQARVQLWGTVHALHDHLTVSLRRSLSGASNYLSGDEF